MLFSKQDLQRVDIEHVRSLPFLERFKIYAPFILKVFKFLLPVLSINSKSKFVANGIIEACLAVMEDEN
jgi:hypothetical protein